MSQFFAGQRVRKVRLAGGPDEGVSVGSTGVIIEIGPFRKGHIFPDYQIAGRSADCLVMYDGFTVSCMALFRCIEPILPEGHRACDEDFKHDLDKLLENADASQHHA